MISPNFATLLVFVQTDAAVDADEADLLLGVCVKRSFDRITVDGQLSTSDMITLQCSGESGVTVEPEAADERVFGEEPLTPLCGRSRCWWHMTVRVPVASGVWSSMVAISRRSSASHMQSPTHRW